MKLCLHCKKETVNPKFCSSSCSASFNNKGIRRWGETHFCLFCKVKLNRNGKYCSNTCQHKFKYLKIDKDIENNNIVSKKSLRSYLIRKDYSCEECHISSWNDKPITLEIDHIDGDGSNNVLNNVRLLCPNCHSQTSTYKGRNIHNPKGKEERYLRYQRTLKIGPDEGTRTPMCPITLSSE